MTRKLVNVYCRMRLSVFAGSITDAQAVDLADDPALTTITNKTRGLPVLP